MGNINISYTVPQSKLGTVPLKVLNNLLKYEHIAKNVNLFSKAFFNLLAIWKMASG